jgi:hypothetical protein
VARIGLSVLVAVTFVCAPAVSLGGQATGRSYAAYAAYAGRAVVDVLRELQAANLKIIFSSERVPSTLRVLREPRGANAREIARQILEPHGLVLEEGPGGTLIVVGKPRVKEMPPKPAAPTAAPASLPPASGDDSEPLRIAEHVDVTDRPTGSGLSPRVYVIEPSEVREMAGGMENVLQSVQVLPGVSGTNDEEGKLAIRGAGPEHNQIVLDGVQIHNPQRFGEFTTSFLNPATAANITLDSGGLDARFGGRLSSVINLETRDGTTERAFALSGALGLTSGDILVEGRMPGTATGSWWATVRGTSYRLVADRFSDGAMPSFADLQVKTTLYPTKRTRLTFFGLAGREMLQELNQDPDGSIRIDASNDGDNRIAAATLRWVPNSRLTSATTLSAYSTSSRHVDTRLAFFSDYGAFDRRYALRDLAVRHQLLYAPSAGHVIDAGVDVHRVRSSWAMTGVKQPDWWRGIGPSTWGELVDYSAGPIDSKLERTQAGGWFQVRFEAGRWLTIEPGVRLDWNSFTGEAAWQPRLRASRMVGRATVWAGVSVQAQTPSHENLQGFEYFDFAASQGLQNERTRQIVVGVERPVPGGFGLRIEAYARSFDRLLVQRQETEAERQYRLSHYSIPADLPPDQSVLEYRPTRFPENTGSGDAAGLEVLLRREGRGVSGWIGYTLAKSTRHFYGQTVPFDFDRRHAMNAVVHVPLSARWRAAATVQLASGFPVTPVLQEVSFSQVIRLDGTRDPLFRTFRDRNGELVSFDNVFLRRLSSINSERTTGYSRVDVRGTYATGGHWEFYGEVLNLFNHRNYIQTVNRTTEEGQVQEVGRANVFNTFERMISFGIRATF